MLRGVVVVLGVSMMMAAGCAAPAASQSAPAADSGAATAAGQPSAPAAQPQAPVSPTVPAGAVRYEIVSDASEARYRVREQLANLDFPNDAVGVTNKITGGIVFDQNGAVVRDQSKLSIDLATLKSDSDRRDNFVRGMALQTSRFPTAEFVPTEVRGVAFPLPTSGEAAFQLLGDLTVRGVTKPVVWDVKAQFADGAVSGSATTAAVWGDFGMSQPRVAIVLSVADTIGLEFDFQMKQAS